MSTDNMADLKIGGAVRYLEALELFTKGDLAQIKEIVPRWMEEYNNEESNGTNGDPVIVGSTPLHLAVQCAKKEVVAAILDIDSLKIPIDAPDTQGMTALHCAAKASRKDIVKLLLRHGADDMLLDTQGRDPLALASDAGVISVIQDHRSEVVRETTARLFSLVVDDDKDAVKAILDNPSESSRINLAARDTDTGGTLLHLAVQHNDIELAKWAITQGVDVFAKDHSGNMAEKYAEHEHKMRELLSQAPMGNARTALSGKAPKFNGHLHKWTNYASGWKSRWFELEGCVLSYYKDKADAESSCRGAINLRIARIILNKEGNQFEVHGKGSIKYRLKAKDSSIAKQWVHLLNLSKQWALENYRNSASAIESPSIAPSVDEDTGSVYMPNSLNQTTSDSVPQGPRSVNMPKEADDSSLSKPSQIHSRKRSITAPTVPLRHSLSSQSVPVHQKEKADSDNRNSIAKIGVSDEEASEPSISSNLDSSYDEDDDDELYMARDKFHLALSELKAQLFIQDQLLANMPTGSGIASGQTGTQESEQFRNVAERSTSQIHALIDDIESSYKATSIAWQARLRREQERIDMLADNLRAVVVESQDMAKSLHKRLQETGGSASASAVSDIENTSICPAEIIELGSVLSRQGISPSPARSIRAGGPNESDSTDTDDIDDDDELEFADASDEFFDAAASILSISNSAQSPTASSTQANNEQQLPGTEPVEDTSIDASDAPEVISRKATATSLVSTKSQPGVAVIEGATDLTALSGYPLPVHIRTSLPKIEKGGPSLNLWSIIKGAIGKDLSKISVPVFFNEPTSFLQRFTEDMEYCELLEIATLLPRSEDRTLFVAGFAMSNYASTFGRIAKPFNPLLGETFEYVRRDKKYRAFSEQVEHHPPISACWVEGRNYMYHADTNIKSKFNGGSLTVVPTGVCHVTLKLPLSFLNRDEERSAGKARQEPEINEEEGYFTEHYTWDKLTTNVNGIMIANFWIEHVGDLDVINHRTGDKTLITFLQSNWMGKNKFRVTGEAHNRRGEKVYDIAGDWRTKLVARPVNGAESKHAAEGDAAEDISPPANIDETGGNNTGDAVKYAELNSITIPKKPFVLWKVNERPKDAAYHLTKFAMSLNDKPTMLDPYLCPTDSRFRPDQRAMETGDYDLADTEKSRLENKQRATRRRREQGDLPPWKPRWFVKDVDPDSGESYWKFTGEYWSERENAARKQKEAGTNQLASPDVWESVEDIF